MSGETFESSGTFTVHGYFEELIRDGKLLGTRRCPKPEEGRAFGTAGERKIILCERLVFDTGPKIKTVKLHKATALISRVYPINGRRLL